MAAVKKIAKQNGYGEKQTVKVITIDKDRRRVECAMRDGAMIWAAVWETDTVFRWPEVGETWTVRQDTGIWRLDKIVQSPLAEAESSATPENLQNLPEGDTRILGNTVHVNTLSAQLIEGSVVTNIFIDVKESAYGAKGNGVANDSVAINLAITTAAAEGGGIVYLPPGIYLLNETLIWKSNVTIMGAGVHATTLKLADGANVNVIEAANYGSGGISDAGLCNFFVEGNATHNISGSGIVSDGVSLFCKELIVLNAPVDGINHTQSKAADTSRALGEDDSYWNALKVLDAGNYGIRTNAHDNHWTNIWVCSNASRNFLVDSNGYASKLFQVHSFGGTEVGIEFKASAKCINCEGEGSTIANVRLNADNVQWIGGSAFFDAGIPAGKVGFEFAEGAGFNTYITGTRVNDCTEGAFKFVSSGSNSRIHAFVSQTEGNVIEGAPGNNIDFDIQLTGAAKLNLPVKSVASSGTIVFPITAKTIEITGNSEITEIEVKKPNQIITMRFEKACTVKKGKNLDIRENFNARPNDTLTLVAGQTEWHEISRSGRTGGTMYGPQVVGAVASGSAPAGSNYESILVSIENRSSITGIAFRVGSEKKNNVRVYIHNKAGEKLVASASTEMGEKENFQKVPFAGGAVVVEPGDYVLTISYSSVNCKIMKARLLGPSLTAVGVAEFGILEEITAPTEPENVDRPILMTY